jgi:hypothetical protein
MIGQSTRGMVSMLLGALLAVAMITPATAAKPLPAFGCALNPGDTTVRWAGYPATTMVVINWIGAADPNDPEAPPTVVATQTVIVGKGRPIFSQPTPAGAVEVGVHFFDATGEFGVAGGTCV